MPPHGSAAAPGWVHAYRQASTELAAVIHGIIVTSVLFAPTGDLVVFFHRPGGARYAWIYGPEHLPTGETDTVEFARLSLLGDLVPPTQWVKVPARADLTRWARQFGHVLWGGRTEQPRPPAG